MAAAGRRGHGAACRDFLRKFRGCVRLATWAKLELMMFVTAPIVVSCLRWHYAIWASRFESKVRSSRCAGSGHRPSYQFGVKHMLIWLTVTGPLLLLVRGLDFGGRGIFTAAVLAVALGNRQFDCRSGPCSAAGTGSSASPRCWLPLLIAQGMTNYSSLLKSQAPQFLPEDFDWYGIVRLVPRRNGKTLDRLALARCRPLGRAARYLRRSDTDSCAADNAPPPNRLRPRARQSPILDHRAGQK